MRVGGTAVSVGVGVTVNVGDDVAVGLGVREGDGVAVGVRVKVGVALGGLVGVFVGVEVGDGVWVAVGSADRKDSGLPQAASTSEIVRKMATLRIFFDGYARTEQMAVPIDVVNSTDIRPEFRRPDPGGGKGSLLARVGSIPISRSNHFGCVRSALQRTRLRRDFTGLDGSNLVTNSNHGLAETIELRLGFTFRGLDHERPGHRK